MRGPCVGATTSKKAKCHLYRWCVFMGQGGIHSSECDVVTGYANKSNDTNSKPSVRETPGAFLMENGCVV